MATFFIGAGDSAGLEQLQATATVTGDTFRPVIPGDRVVEGVAFLDWYNQDGTGGGEFGEPPPDNARIQGTGVLTGTLPLVAAGADDTTVAATAEFAGSLVVDAIIDEAEIAAVAQVLSNVQIDTSIPGEITAVAFLEGELRVALFPELSLDVLSEQFGTRPALSFLIRVDNVAHEGNLKNSDGSFRVALYEPFRMAPQPLYTAPPGDTLALSGARPGYIGMRVETDIQGDGTVEEVILFRRPYENEVVGVVGSLLTEKWNDDVSAWETYVGLPERALRGLQLFEVLDPDGVYQYLARVVTLLYSKLSFDTRRIVEFVDAETCPDAFLPLLASNFGAEVSPSQPEAEQRETIRTWVALMKRKGLAAAIVTALRNLGYDGYATQVWTRPGASATEFEERPFNYTNELPDDSDTAPDSQLYPAAQVIIHLNLPTGEPLAVIDGSVKQEVARFLKLYVLPAHVRIRGFATDIPAGDDTIAVDDGNNLGIVADGPAVVVTAVADPATVAVVGLVLPFTASPAVQAGPATTSIDVTVTP